MDNNEHLEISSPEIYELQILSETQVDENELSNAAKGSSCRNEQVAWYAVAINLKLLLCWVNIMLQSGRIMGKPLEFTGCLVLSNLLMVLTWNHFNAKAKLGKLECEILGYIILFTN